MRRGGSQVTRIYVPDAPAPGGEAQDLVVPLRLATECGELSLLYTTVFGAPRDVTLDEIAIETFFPADRRTAELMRGPAG